VNSSSIEGSYLWPCLEYNLGVTLATCSELCRDCNLNSSLWPTFFYFLHVCIRRRRDIQTSDFRFIKCGLSRLSFFLEIPPNVVIAKRNVIHFKFSFQRRVIKLRAAVVRLW
jgi:hypothetical protein